MESEYYKIIVVGDAGTGKSALILRYANDDYDDYYISTVGVDFKAKTVNHNGKMARLHIWDTAGQERFNSITQSYYNTSEGIVVAFDLTNRESFESLDKWFNEIDRFEKTNVPIILVGTKKDRYHEYSISQTRVSENEIKEFLKNINERMNVTYIETSSKHNQNVRLVFETLGKELMERRDKQNRHYNSKNNANNTNNEIDPMSDIVEIDNNKKICCSIL